LIHELGLATSSHVQFTPANSDLPGVVLRLDDEHTRGAHDDVVDVLSRAGDPEIVQYDVAVDA